MERTALLHQLMERNVERTVQLQGYGFPAVNCGLLPLDQASFELPASG